MRRKLKMNSKEDNIHFDSNHFSSLVRTFSPTEPLTAGSKSYPPSSPFSPSTMPPSKQISLNTLQISAIALKERCMKQERRIELLEEENCRLHYALDAPYHSHLPLNDDNLSENTNAHCNSKEAAELDVLAKLQQANYFLRERNLELTQQLSHKSNALRKSQNHTLDDYDSLNQSYNNKFATDDANIAYCDSIKGHTGDKSYREDSALEQEEEEESMGRGITMKPKTECDRSLSRIRITEQNMQDFKERLLVQQKTLVDLLQEHSLATEKGIIKHNIIRSDRKSYENLKISKTGHVPLSRDDIIPNDMGEKDCNKNNERLCPMCEAEFPLSEILQEDFEAHVLGHFSYEAEAETLKHYDIVLDAQRSLDGDL